MITLLTPVGRMVSGHPMESSPVIDDRTKAPKLDKNGAPLMSTYIGLAIPKGQEANWYDTEWGKQIYAVGAAAWPAGEYRSPIFAWKVTDGDSRVPNKKGKIPAEREGWPGHWILHCSTMYSTLRCYHVGQYAPHQVIQRKDEIKRGDYVRLQLSVRGNNPSESPGVYVNPELFELTRAGILIESEGANAEEAFGSTAPQLPAGALVDTAIADPNPAVTPNQEFVTNAAGTTAPPPPPAPDAPPPPPASTHMMTAKANGATYEAMIAKGWTDDLLIQHGMMTA
jgi:hypothetical protein